MVTVGSVLALNELALHAVHVPAPELDVRWVATSELLDPAPFLEGGEILLTTGLETRGWRREWDGYVSRLADVADRGARHRYRAHAYQGAGRTYSGM